MSDADIVRRITQPLSGSSADYDSLLNLVGNARFVLLGEASHGTHEFYFERAQITKQLIIEKGFTVIAIEADWPDANRVHRYVRGASNDSNADEALSGFRRFPTWMWRNTVVVEFVEWLRQFNKDVDPKKAPAGFYGLDLYSLHASIDAVLSYLQKVDPEAARRARRRYSCFEHFSQEPQEYGYAATAGIIESCEDEVVDQLVEIQRKATEFLSRDGQRATDELFFAEQNARLVKNAEQYYRSMFRGRASSWNLRDRHMVETIEALVAHLNGSRQPKAIVWAHNSHLGDARATEMSERGELNVGQLIRERFGNEAVLVGFTTHHGSVTAASDWGEIAERKRVRPALPGSYEELFHEVGVPGFLIDLREGGRKIDILREARLERAIGVIYRPETERLSHYFHARLPEQFDAIIHIDETRALGPLERTSVWEKGELPETYPFTV
ncbi:MAG: erythromycin esterase [Verrucomicrobia bacterium]|nr:MAG: erythromycin esterase [Verrucomicrobiota bacterium]PYK94610.1 MAG: erythromycin esterase [Verrucomicrobiota bacterium]